MAIHTTPVVELHNCQLTHPSERKGQPDKLALLVNNLVIHPGDHIALLGKSGTGKSTLLRKLRQTTKTEASWCPQQASLVPQLKVFHNIYSGGLDRHSSFINLMNLVKPAALFKKQITELTASLNIADLLWTKASDLSGGQQQRVAIARCLYQQKKLLLADEPVSALDKLQGQVVVSDLIAQHETSVTALHDANLALKVCNRIIGLKDQQILFDCSTKDISEETLKRLYQ